MLARNLWLGRIARVSRNARVWRFSTSSARYASDDVKQKDKELGELDSTENTGVIEKSNRETLLYFDKVSRFNFSSWKQYRTFEVGWRKLTPMLFNENEEASIKHKIEQLCLPLAGVTINNVVPKDGGVFVRFRINDSTASISEINAKLQENCRAFNEKRDKSLLATIQYPKTYCYPVKGTPWIEDLRRIPNVDLKVSFEGTGELPEESLYQIMRRYGKIVDIFPQPVDSKEVPKYCIVRFQRIKSAISAKNCVNGLKINDTVLHLKYVSRNTKSWFKKLILDHQRISIPLILALLVAMSTVIFEPIRVFFIEENMSKRISRKLERYITNNSVIRYLTDSAQSMKNIVSLGKKAGAAGDFRKTVWTDRIDKIKEIKLWIEENINTFIIVRGPKGIGKQELVMEHVIKDGHYGRYLYVNCESLYKSRSDSEFLKNASAVFGYFPVFAWLNSWSKFLDLAVQGLTGQKSGLSESTETQFRNILTLTGIAVRHLALKSFGKSASSVSESTTEEDYLQQNPAEKPIIVIDKFELKQDSESSSNYGFIYKSLAAWTSFLVSMNLAHVIYLVDDIGSIPVLQESLPDQVFKYCVLNDASEENSVEFVMSELHKEAQEKPKNSTESDSEFPQQVHFTNYSKETVKKALAPIGGRMLDLQAFVRRVKSGETPQEAQREMIRQASEQLIQMNLNNAVNTDPLQVARSWEIIKQISKEHMLPYTKIYTSLLFKSAPEKCLNELENSGLVTLVKENGVIKYIKPSKPIYQAAFENIVSDKKMFNVLETSYLLKLIGFENKRISAWEDELSKLSYVTKDDLVTSRLQWLSNKIDGSCKNIKTWESHISKLVAELNNEKKEKNVWSVFGW